MAEGSLRLITASAVLLGVVILLILFRKPLIRLADRIAINASPGTRNFFRRRADTLIPDWREVTHRPRYSFEWRLRAVQEQPPMFHLLGGVYMDINLSPVTLPLEEGEFSNLDSIELQVGGSAVWVGRYLASHGVKSHLYTKRGDDYFSTMMQRRLRHEPWIQKIHNEASKDTRCGLSINLQQRQGHPGTLTSRGALSRLDWGYALRLVRRDAIRGGVIYISGYFRTGLFMNLRSSLALMPHKTLIVIDHGRFQPEDFPDRGPALRDVFRQGLVDIYICSYDEFCSWVGSCLDENLKGQAVEEVASRCAGRGILPEVTVVTGSDEPDEAVAHYIIRGRCEVVEPQQRTLSAPPRLGARNIFNAAFLYALCTLPSHLEVQNVLKQATRVALENWARNSPEDERDHGQ